MDKIGNQPPERLPPARLPPAPTPAGKPARRGPAMPGEDLGVRNAAGGDPLDAVELLPDDLIDAGLDAWEARELALPPALAAAVELGRLTRRQAAAYERVREALREADPEVRALWEAWAEDGPAAVNYASQAGRELLSIAMHHLRPGVEAPGGRSPQGYVAEVIRAFNRP